MGEMRGLIVLGLIVILAGLVAAKPTVTLQVYKQLPATEQQNEPYHQSTQGNDSAKNIPGSSPTSPLYVRADCDQGCGHSENHDGFLQKLWTDPVADFTAALFIATFFLWRVTAETLTHAKESSDRRLRAYLGVPKRRVDFGEEPWLLRCSITVKNFGRTPAFRVHESFDAWVDTYPIPRRIPPLNFKKDGTVTVYLPPSDDFIIFDDVELSEGQFDAILDEKLAIWVTGCIKFTDAFKRTRNVPFRYIMTGPDLTSADRRMEIFSEGNEVEIE